MSDLNEGEEGHPHGVRPPKGSSREGDDFIHSSQMKEALDKGLATDFSAPGQNLPPEDFFDSSHREADYVQPSVSARTDSKPFPSHYSQSYPQPSFSCGFPSSGEQSPYVQPSSRAFSRPGGMDPQGPSNRYHNQWQSSISGMNSFQLMENRIADMERRLLHVW